MHALSLHTDEFEYFKELKIARFEQFGLDHEVINKCRNWMPRIQSTIAAQFFRSSSSNSVHLIRIVVPYTSFMSAGIYAVVKEIENTWNLLLKNILGEIRVQLAFCNAGAPLYVALRNMKL